MKESENGGTDSKIGKREKRRKEDRKEESKVGKFKVKENRRQKNEGEYFKCRRYHIQKM